MFELRRKDKTEQIHSKVFCFFVFPQWRKQEERTRSGLLPRQRVSSVAQFPLHSDQSAASSVKRLQPTVDAPRAGREEVQGGEKKKTQNPRETRDSGEPLDEKKKQKK